MYYLKVHPLKTFQVYRTRGGWLHCKTRVESSVIALAVYLTQLFVLCLNGYSWQQSAGLSRCSKWIIVGLESPSVQFPKFHRLCKILLVARAQIIDWLEVIVRSVVAVWTRHRNVIS